MILLYLFSDVVKTFQTAVSALRSTVSNDLSGDKVANAMDEIQEVNVITIFWCRQLMVVNNNYIWDFLSFLNQSPSGVWLLGT